MKSCGKEASGAFCQNLLCRMDPHEHHSQPPKADMHVFTDLGLFAQAVNWSPVGLVLWATRGPAARRQNACAGREHVLLCCQSTLRALDPGRKDTWLRSSNMEMMTTDRVRPGMVQAFSGAGVSGEAGHGIPRARASLRGPSERPRCGGGERLLGAVGAVAWRILQQRLYRVPKRRLITS